jgi:transcriptional regulator with XRE-family HTH domain
MSQRELADRLRELGMDVDASAVSRIEKGVRAIRLSEAEAIARVFGSPIEAFLRAPDQADPEVVLRYADAVVDAQGFLLQAARRVDELQREFERLPEPVVQHAWNCLSPPERSVIETARFKVEEIVAGRFGPPSRTLEGGV